uniref:Uncharacterized protein n=1 Tax=Oryza sativa subsp. japonica TaxID=39947 RepID=Q6YXD9_ORYSJ|nr:hypothetical protein [Oryza sativa Japonica Group]
MASPAREERSSRQRVSCGRKTRARDGGGLRDNLGYGSGSFPREETGQRRATLSSAAGGNGVQDEGGDTGCDLVFHRRAGGLPDVVVVVVLDVAGEDSIVGRLLGTLPKREKWLGLERLARGATGTSSSGRGDGNGDLRAPSGGGQGLGSRNTCREARPLLWLTGVAFSLVASSLGNSHVFLRSDLRHYHYHCDY